MSRAISKFSQAFVVALVGASAIPVFGQQAAAPYTQATRYNAGGQVTGTIAPDPDGAGGSLAYRAMRNTYGLSGTATSGLLVKVETGQLSAWRDDTIAPADWNALFAIYLTQTFAYDAYGRKIKETTLGTNGIAESVVQYTYDDWDRVRCRAVRMNTSAFATVLPNACELGPEGASGPDRISRYTYDSLDQVLIEERAVGTPLQQTYVTNTYLGRKLSTQTDAKGNRTTLDYGSDGNWRLWRRYYPSPNSPGSSSTTDFNQYGYDANGNVTTEVKRNTKSITNSYDNNNRLIFKDLSDNTYSGDVSYGYDLRGLTLYSCFGAAATAACDTSGEGETNTFDGFGNLTTRTSRIGTTSRILTYQYDADGNRTRITHPGGQAFSYGFDGLNRFCSLNEGTTSLACNSTSPVPPLQVIYQPSGGRSAIHRMGGAVTSIAPDNALRLGSFTQDFAAGTTNDLTNSFQYNPASQVTRLTQSNALYTYAETQTRAGTYVPNGLNQYTSIGGQSVGYDSAGNLASDGTFAYTYDMENRLVAVSSPAAGLKYDPLGRLVELSVVPGSTTQFHFDGDALVGEYVNGSLTRRYVHGDHVDEPLQQYNGTAVGAGSRRFLHADHQGSIIAHSDSAGAVLAKNSYDPFGIPASTNIDRFGYTGQTWLKELGLNYYKARIYSPRIGRFLQTDPIFYSDDMNMYAYVGSDPFNRTDPHGKCGVFIGACIGALVGLAVEGASQIAAGEFNGRNLIAATVSGAIVGQAVTMGAGTLAAPLAEAGAALRTVKTVEALGGAAGAIAGTLPASAASSAITGTPMPNSGELLKQGAAAAVGAGVGVAVGVGVGALKPAVEKTLGAAGATIAEVVATEGASTAAEKGAANALGSGQNPPPPELQR